MAFFQRKTVQKLLAQGVHVCTAWANSILKRKTMQNEPLVQSVYLYTDDTNSIL